VKIKGDADYSISHKDTQKAVSDAENDLADTGRVLLRKSGTEPLIRVMVEAQCPIKSLHWAQQIATAIKAI
jgi:phosphoglucosamine mutase